jgi:tRNA threonylcarbamoyladenosine biosynthesis protein TsaB
MAIILSLETSTDVCSVALHDNGTLLAGTEIHEPQSHAAQLPTLILSVLKTAGLDLGHVQAVAVTNGPGSYTGLRIGTSTAKGLCYALDIPLIALGSLELLAFQATKHSTQADDLLCPMIDARRMEVYCLVADKDLRVVQPVSAMVIEEHSFAELLEGNRMLFFGNGAEKCRTVLHHPNAIFLDNIFPLAASLGIMAEEKYNQSVFEDLVKFKPFYLKEFVAKRAETGV